MKGENKIKPSLQNKKALLFIDHKPYANPLAMAKLEEFKELARAGGLHCIGVAYQTLNTKQKKPHPATFIGTGKIKELLNLKTLLNHQEVNKVNLDTNYQTKKQTCRSKLQKLKPAYDIIVFNHDLLGVQIRNLEKTLNTQVIDRNQLIIEIFAQRARTYEGKLQVELAQVLDEMTRMVGAWKASLSRQGGRRGAKGPGEKAIEVDRRTARVKARNIQKKLKKIQQVRKSQRQLRQKNQVQVLALVGYTNSGKSSLLNALTKKNTAEVKSLPFMTLDPTIRKVRLSPLKTVLMTDTVGFIQNLSPHLIEAFKATLEESKEANFLLHVIDLSSPLMQTQIETVNKLIKDLGWSAKPKLYVYNKTDLAPKALALNNPYFPRVFVSAKKKWGLNNLIQNIEHTLSQNPKEEKQLYFPKNKGALVYHLDREALISKKEESPLGTLCYARLSQNTIKKWQKFIIK